MFARAVLGRQYSASEAARLKLSFDRWTKRFGEFMDKSLPPSPWGPGRLDAFNMIFNRVAARDLNQPQNFAVADAPVSYPFLWNASKQDRTQWTGGVENGLFIHALARNTGEVLGVFAEFTPKRITLPSGRPLILYRDHSADFEGLQKLEEKMAILQPPPWPFALKPELAAEGEKLFERHCSSCHAQVASSALPNGMAWATPVQAVGTDPKMANNAANRMVDTGLLDGAMLPRPLGARLESRDKTANVLATSVIGILRAGLPTPAIQRAIVLDLQKLPPRDPDRLKFVVEKLGRLFQKPPAADAGAYEARVLYGIWATAPYLHNGSVPNLWELLKPPKDRKTTFKVGSRRFDEKNVGFATDESPFENGDFTVDPLNANGNGNAGHAYGTDLSEAERWALIEYLKKL
jgi:mono/diheme cytochrome c family protein